MVAKYITDFGLIRDVKPKNGSTFTLEEMQGYVQGYVEVIRIGTDEIMCINEEGKFIDSCFLNKEATKIALENNAIMESDFICGNVVICQSKMLP